MKRRRRERGIAPGVSHFVAGHHPIAPFRPASCHLQPLLQSVRTVFNDVNIVTHLAVERYRVKAGNHSQEKVVKRQGIIGAGFRLKYGAALIWSLFVGCELAESHFFLPLLGTEQSRSPPGAFAPVRLQNSMSNPSIPRQSEQPRGRRANWRPGESRVAQSIECVREDRI